MRICETNPPVNYQLCNYLGGRVSESGRVRFAMAALGGVATVTSLPRLIATEVGIDNRRRRVSIGGAGNGTTDKVRQS
jgi:hypothetical protein